MTQRATTPFTFAALAAAILACASPAHAFTCTWTGAASGLANNPANWSCGGSPNPLPVNGDDLVFPDNAPNAASYSHNFLPVPAFGNVTLGKGYTLNGNGMLFNSTASVTGPLTSQVPFNGMGTGTLTVTGGASINDLAYFQSNLMNIANIAVGDASGPAHAYIASPSFAPIAVQAQGRLGLAVNADVSSLQVATNGTLVLSEPPPGFPPPGTLGGPKVYQQLLLDTGSMLEYRIYANGYGSGFIAMQPGSVATLNAPTLRVMLDDPSQPEPVGSEREIISFPAGSYALTGAFAGLADGATVQASNAPGIYYRINYNTNPNFDGSVTITRVAGPLVPPPGPGNGGGTTAVPALGPAGLGLMSLLVAGVGALRRRKHGA